eukprot:1289278-Amphidinium_carterae.1
MARGKMLPLILKNAPKSCESYTIILSWGIRRISAMCQLQHRHQLLLLCRGSLSSITSMGFFLWSGSDAMNMRLFKDSLCRQLFLFRWILLSFCSSWLLQCHLNLSIESFDTFFAVHGSQARVKTLRKVCPLTSQIRWTGMKEGCCGQFYCSHLRSLKQKLREAAAQQGNGLLPMSILGCATLLNFTEKIYSRIHGLSGCCWKGVWYNGKLTISTLAIC